MTKVKAKKGDTCVCENVQTLLNRCRGYIDVNKIEIMIFCITNFISLQILSILGLFLRWSCPFIMRLVFWITGNNIITGGDIFHGHSFFSFGFPSSDARQNLTMCHVVQWWKELWILFSFLFKKRPENLSQYDINRIWCISMFFHGHRFFSFGVTSSDARQR